MTNQSKIRLLFSLVLLFIILTQLQSDFATNLYHSFNRTLIAEQRYQLLLTGLANTLLISIIAIIIGTVLGGLVCYLRINKNQSLSNLAKIFIKIIQGTPITVLLLIFYYVVFGNINIDPIIVAIITFAIYFSAYIAEIFRGAIEAINKNQIEASYSLGFSKIQTIRYILMPQALTYIIPVFKNEVVSLIKLTSFAGYISIIDLTKSTDIIRNRTYEAFFPLIFTALIYFIICHLIGMLFDTYYKKINPRAASRKRVV